MAEKRQLDAEDVAIVNELRSKFMACVAQIGQVEVEIRLLTKRLESFEEQRESLWSRYLDTQNEEKVIVDKLTEKYGNGVLDLDSNIFIPNE